MAFWRGVWRERCRFGAVMAWRGVLACRERVLWVRWGDACSTLDG
jgi:hypothetical protein